MSIHELLTRPPQISYTNNVCQGCALDKHHKDQFLIGRSTCAKASVELIHSDLMSFPTPSFLGARYVLTFIDDFSRCTWVYFLMYKSDIFDSFHNFNTFVGKKSGLSVMRIHTNNGKEYMN